MNEDTWAFSNAGKYKSFIGVPESETLLMKFINEVFASYGTAHKENQCLIQPTLENVSDSGVVFTRDPETYAPYYIINYETSGNTSTVTGGLQSDTEKLFVLRKNTGRPVPDKRLKKLITAIKEIETVIGYDSLDIEFAIADEKIYILQVRPLLANKKLQFFSDNDFEDEITLIQKYVKELNRKSDSLHNGKTILGIMPDWNPAEIIGRTPRPLAFSLYQYLITDEIWGIQRAQYGYRDTYPAPLMVGLCGQGYINTRLSFSSFIPHDLPEKLASKLLDFYMAKLDERPELHDKIEFEIAFTCFTFDFDERVSELAGKSFSKKEVRQIRDSLLKLTRTALNKRQDFFRTNYRLLKILIEKQQSRPRVEEYNDINQIAVEIKRTLDNCKKYGTLPFAHFARSGFVATAILRSLVQIKVMSADECGKFISKVETIASECSKLANLMKQGALPQHEFIERYGHLRPGTYDILSDNYRDGFGVYFKNTVTEHASPQKSQTFRLHEEQRLKIDELFKNNGFQLTTVEFEKYFKFSIQAREYSKFVFTKEIDRALCLIARMGELMGFSREDMSYIPINEIIKFAGASANYFFKQELKAVIERYRASYSMTKAVKLPYIITEPEDTEYFYVTAGYPNYITHKIVTGEILSLESCKNCGSLDNKIVFINNADPGFDWIFSHKILGLLTAFGGANSHMAIRAAEFGLPAAIGCGELLSKNLKTGVTIELNCLSRQIHILT